MRRGSMSMAAYLDKVKCIIDLVAARQVLDDQTITHYVVSGLGQDFEPFAQTITAREVSVNFTTLQNRLLTQDHWVQIQDHLNSLMVSNRPSVNVASRGGQGGPNQGRGRNNGRRGGCSKGRGHTDRFD
ncbi:hypothetical protein H6P81_018761 [Aristolochia fimbriata]|uniref:Gag protein n=1 Tax=Aristolochia fimbriata TaxID=158543 RepID=A0AAV7E521_ARIFI|nr:hypothetical protein H6P81_018761 [Aristolochia fimbriata]